MKKSSEPQEPSSTPSITPLTATPVASPFRHSMPVRREDGIDPTDLDCPMDELIRREPPPPAVARSAVVALAEMLEPKERARLFTDLLNNLTTLKLSSLRLGVVCIALLSIVAIVALALGLERAAVAAISATSVLAGFTWNAYLSGRNR